MLEIMNQDYIRTARAKGLTERTVIMRHAFRNALIPIATIVAFDIGALIGGAVITETVFAGPRHGLAVRRRDSRASTPTRSWRSSSCVAVMAMVFNLIADLAYSALDPRVRVKVMSQPSQQEAIMADDAASRQQAAAGIEPVMEAKGLSQGQIVRKRFLGHRGAMIGLVVFAFIFILAFTSVGLTRADPRLVEVQLRATSRRLVNDGAPTSSLWPLAWGEHPFGQDRIGRDIFAMTMRGTQQSIIIMFVIGLIASVIGVVVGAIAGYFRGWADAVLMRITDVIIIIPALVLGRRHGRRRQPSGSRGAGSPRSPAPTASWPSDLPGPVIWIGLARLVRGEFLSLREREFVDAARVAGASNAADHLQAHPAEHRRRRSSSTRR